MPRLPVLGRGAALCSALVIALTSAGCSYQLDSLWSKSGEEAEYSGSIHPAMPKQAIAMPPENDLAAARAAVSEALSTAGKQTSIPWENPRTGARGTVTPIAAAYNQDEQTCQDFLASFVRDGAESWLQGQACRPRKGRWEVKSLKPWQKG